MAWTTLSTRPLLMIAPSWSAPFGRRRSSGKTELPLTLILPVRYCGPSWIRTVRYAQRRSFGCACCSSFSAFFRAFSSRLRRFSASFAVSFSGGGGGGTGSTGARVAGSFFFLAFGVFTICFSSTTGGAISTSRYPLFWYRSRMPPVSWSHFAGWYRFFDDQGQYHC